MKEIIAIMFLSLFWLASIFFVAEEFGRRWHESGDWSFELTYGASLLVFMLLGLYSYGYYRSSVWFVKLVGR